MRTSTVIVTDNGDLTADSVIRHMAPGDTIRLDPAKLNADYVISASFGSITGWRTVIETPHRSFEVGSHTSVWWRKPTAAESLEGDAAWVADENQMALLGLLRTSNLHIWVNDPGVNERAALKAPQLALARTVGLDVPETIITNDPTTAARFVARHEGAASKAMRQKHTLFVPTTSVSPSDDLSAVSEAMHQFQRRIDKLYDVRVIVIGGRVFATKITSPGLDVRTARREDQSYDVIRPPGYVTKALFAYMRAEGLRYSAFDFVADKSGLWWFLENNPNGEFGYLEEATGMAISRALADYLHQRPAW